jgi:hypothetical protein
MSTWRCEELDRWLDDGRPSAGRERFEAHAGACARCSAALAAATDVERALGLPEQASRAPAGFTDAVMRRTSMARRSAMGPAAPSLIGLLLTDPLAATACVLALLVAWWREPLWAMAVAVSARAAALVPAPSPLVGSVPLHAFASPAALAGLSIAVLPLVLVGSWILMGWCERTTARAMDVSVR